MIGYRMAAPFCLAFGAWMAVHCAAVARRGVCPGRTGGIFDIYAWEWKPARFCIAVGLTALASPPGLLLFVFGGGEPFLRGA